jgi:putative peptidoglycan lipid II flippase
MYLPIGLFGVSIATAAIPTLSGYAAASDTGGMRATVSSGLRLMLMLNVPATVGLVVLADPIVAAIFERGAFTAADTRATAAALMFYAPGLVGYSAVKLASPAFYALRDSRTPVLVSVGSVAMNVVLNLTLVHVLGYRGLALGTALSALLNASVLLILLHRRIGGLDGGRVALTATKILAASAVMALAVVKGLDTLEASWSGQDLTARVGRLAIAIALGLVALALAARLLRIAEFNEAVRRILARARPPRS